MKKALFLSSVCLQWCHTAACGSSCSRSSHRSSRSFHRGSGAEDVSADKTFVVGICQLVQHPALDAATQGFKDALTEALGDKVIFPGAERFR